MKALFTYLRTFLLCFGLLQLQMLPVYAQAQEQQQEDAYVEQYEQSQGQQGNSQRTSRVATDQGEEVGGDIMGQLINLITMMSIGMLGVIMATYTPITIDMKIATAAALAYIYGEVSALKATRDKMESKNFVLTKYSDGTEDNLQRKALEEQKKSYEDLASMMDQKANMQKMASVGFFLAAATALVMKKKLTALTAKCLSVAPTVAKTTAATAAACSGACAPATKLAASCGIAAGSVAATVPTMEAAEVAPMQSTANVVTVEATATTQDAATAPCPMTAAACVPPNLFRKVVNVSSPVSMVAGVAVAGLMRALGLGSLSGLTSAIFLPIAKVYDFAFATPVKRSVTFAVLGGIILAGSAQSAELAEKMRSNVEKIDALLRQMDKLQNVQPASLIASTSLNQNGLFMAANRTDEQRLEAQQAPCPDNKPRDNRGQCRSLANEIDTGIRETLSGVDGLPDGFISSAGQIGNVADDVLNNGGLTSGSLDSANSLLANSNAINNLNRRLREGLNDDLKKSGLKQIDFEKEQGKFAASLRKAVVNGINDAKGKDSASFMAAFSGMRGLPLVAEEVVEGEQLVDANFSEPSNAPNVAAFQMPEAPKFNLDLGNDGFNVGADESNLAYNDKGEMMVNISDEYETSESSEIVSNKDVSIFKVISVRYLKSGIPKLIGLED